ncbi:threonine/homoserine/homoserine lactone efflux protein [Maritalea mobilis]|uniref:Threonine/homoserine/homoserine lactone efflux protein n=1 Tax=Maritalea mobilis TaxID=483324 RepID=A0A4R6VW01_9HYPH|nr:LysE family translocator [Maritalea mobilis]TDQ66957.1 threonine/homoserine/homoserine lactone efflux protein [Maritalea mobilis]
MHEIIAHLPQLLFALGVFVLASGSPGPATLSVCQTSASLGRKAGFVRASGIIVGSLFWGILAAAGLVAALQQFAQLLIVLKIVGGLYLLYLAYKSFVSFRSPASAELAAPADTSLVSLFFGGIALHLTNPKAVFAWGAVITMGMCPGAPWWMSFFIFALAGTCSMTLNYSYAYLFSTAHAVQLYRSAKRGIDGVMTVVFGAAGIKLITSP